MKKIILFISCFLIFLKGIGQYVSVDSAFEQVLINQNIDSEGIADDRILLSDALSITTLNLSGSEQLVNNPPGLGLTNINGIEHFTNLEILRIEGNDLSNLNLSQNKLLKELRAWNNDMETLNVSGLNNLETVGLNFNNLSNVDFSTNTAIQELDITDNNLTSISMGNKENLGKFTLSNNPNLNTLNISGSDGSLLTFDTRGNINLSCIEVSNLSNALSQTGWFKDSTTNYSENCSGQNYTFIPDIAFENYLIAEGIDSQGISNGRVLTSDVQNVTTLEMPNLGIADLSGLEDFINLLSLNISFNNLNSLSLQNTTLQVIRANDCNLGGKSISFINNGAILSNVTTLELQNNDIGNVNSTISFGGIPNVTYLDISDNSFGTLQLNETTLVETLLASGCTNLNNIAGLENLNAISSLDVSFCNLNNINISQNGSLAFINISGNNLTTLNTTNNPFLNEIDASGNNLNSLNLATSTSLETLYLENNELTSLTISSADQNLVNFNATGNVNLECIQVTNVSTAEAQPNWQKNLTTTYRTDCNNNTPFTVSSTIQNAGTAPNYEITEGDTFLLNFEADNNASNGSTYTPIVTFSLNEASSTEDFLFNGETTIPNTPFIVSSSNPDGTISIEAIDDGTNEGDEVYTITITSSDPSKYSMATPTSFTVTVSDKTNNEADTFYMITTVLGANKINTVPELEYQELYEVEEGSNFAITLNDITPNNAGGLQFNLPWSYSGDISDENLTLENADGTILPFNNQILSFTVDNNNEYEIKINISLDDNSIFEPNKEFFIQFKTGIPDPDDKIFIQNASSPDAAYRYKFIIKENDLGGNIYTTFSNIGGTEDSGIPDKLEISLKNPDGSYYKNTTGTDIVIPIEFNFDDIINPVDFVDISPNPLPQNFTIKPNDSTSTIELNYLNEANSNDIESNYFNLVLKENNSSLNIIYPENNFEIKVLDKSNSFDIITDFNGNVQRRDIGGEDCCYWYQIEEGEDILFYFDAEKGVKDSLPYVLNIELLKAENTTSAQAIYGDGSFTLATNTLENIPRSVKVDQIDNFLNMRILEGNYNAKKSFRIKFSPPENSDYNYVGSKDRDAEEATVSFDFEIIDAVPANIEITRPTAEEENPISSFGELKIKLNNPRDETTRIEFKLNENTTSSAKYNIDYYLESNSRIEVNEKNKTGAIFLDANSIPAEVTIKIIPINEETGLEIAENTEFVIFELLDSFGYSLGQESTATIEILDTDEADYNASVSITNGEERIFEDQNETPNIGVFIIALNKMNTSGRDIKVRFSLNQNIADAAEGIDDYKVYDGKSSDKIDITLENIKEVTIPNGSQFGHISIEALEDGKTEKNEKVAIILEDGFDYKPINENENPFITIISKDQNKTQIDFTAITIKVSSATCPGVYKGEISMTNDTPFNMEAHLLFESNLIAKNTIAKNTSLEMLLFDNLTSGDYEIKLTILSENGEEIPDDIPPTYKVKIRELNGTNLISKTINYNSNKATLLVSGSTSYKVTVGNKTYEYNFGDLLAQTMDIPLTKGKNNIVIKGEASCQGIITDTIFLNEYLIYPNPSSDHFTMTGLNYSKKAVLFIHDYSGKKVLEEKIISDMQKINISALSPGIYFIKIMIDKREDFKLKFIKR
jgi:Leucine-rich repeat (LRR) protein